jgi:hypothetical protein
LLDTLTGNSFVPEKKKEGKKEYFLKGKKKQLSKTDK